MLVITRRSAAAELTSKMPTSLLEALQRVYLDANDKTNEYTIDDDLDIARPLKRTKLSENDLKRALEKEFLAPSTSFSGAWLNKLQQ
jgi:antiviral helicase SKI2